MVISLPSHKTPSKSSRENEPSTDGKAPLTAFRLCACPENCQLPAIGRQRQRGNLPPAQNPRRGRGQASIVPTRTALRVTHCQCEREGQICAPSFQSEVSVITIRRSPPPRRAARKCSEHFLLTRHWGWLRLSKSPRVSKLSVSPALRVQSPPVQAPMGSRETPPRTEYTSHSAAPSVRGVGPLLRSTLTAQLSAKIAPLRNCLRRNAERPSVSCGMDRISGEALSSSTR